MTELISLFIATAWVVDIRPQSLLLVSPPGSGKTQILDRFRINSFLSYHSDLTLRQLIPQIKKSSKGIITHLVFTEFQKLFQRKASTAENCLGTLVQAIEEGAGTISIGPENDYFHSARIGILAAMTHGTLRRKHEQLEEMGLLDRMAVVDFTITDAEQLRIMDNIVHGHMDDLQPVWLRRPQVPVMVTFPIPLGEQLKEIVWSRRLGDSSVRLFNRCRALTLAATLLDGRDVVAKKDIDRLMLFQQELFLEPERQNISPNGATPSKPRNGGK